MDIPRPDGNRRRLRRLLATSALVAGLLGGVTVAFSRLGSAPPKVGRSVLAVDRVQRGRFVREVRAAGTLVPERAQAVTAAVEGTVVRQLADPGAVLDEGEAIVQLSNPEREGQLREAERTLKSAQTDLVDFNRELRAMAQRQSAALSAVEEELRAAGAQLRAAEELAQQGTLGKDEVEQPRQRCRNLKDRRASARRRLGVMRRSMVALDSARRARIAELAAEVDQVRADVDHLLIKAPMAGVLSETHFQPGQRLAAGAAVARIADPGRLHARLAIDEHQAREVRAGQKVAIDTESAVVPGTVLAVERPRPPDGFTALVALGGKLPRDAHPDLRVEGVITVEVASDVLYVGRPAMAAADSTVGLFKLAGERSARRVPVRIGRASGETVEILDGLRPGDEVILSDMSAWQRYDTLRLD